jgi:restriction system protein
LPHQIASRVKTFHYQAELTGGNPFLDTPLHASSTTKEGVNPYFSMQRPAFYGLFVIETKNMDGWIFGSAKQEMWTQQVFKKKFKFQNPLRQNYRHTRCLAEFLGLDHDLLHSVVFFIGNVDLKTPMPDNALTKGLSNYIRRFTTRVLAPAWVVEIEHQLKACQAGSVVTRSERLESLEERYESVTICPKCGGVLIKRLAKRGPKAGSAFYGCATYPRCRYTRNASDP